MVVNISGKPLDDTVYSALQKGLNYTLAPTSLAHRGHADWDGEGYLLPAEMAEDVRQETVRIIRDCSRPKDNLTGAERKALRALRKNTDLTILPADKGNATVVLNTVEYNQKIGTLLEDLAYRRLAKDPTEAVDSKTILLLKKSSLAEKVCKRLLHAGFRPPRLYRLSKILKAVVPPRPIASNIEAPTYQISKYLACILSLLVERSIHHVKSSIEFVHTLGTLSGRLEDLMVSFDVVSLFTQVPIVQSLDLLSQHFSEDITVLFRHVLPSSYFSLGGQFYEQTDSVAMGSPLYCYSELLYG
jgi:hypothetical protein